MDEFLSRLGIHKSTQITFRDAVRVKSIKPQSTVPPNQFPEFMLHKLMLSNVSCRSLPQSDSPSRQDVDPFLDKEDEELDHLIHPMDVLSYLFLSAHPLFRQTLSLQLSKCQLALPLVIPDPSTYLQFSLSPLIRHHISGSSPVSLSVCSEQLPVVAFLRVGDFGPTPHSKSQLLNRVLGNRNECFFNRNMSGSIKSRVLFDGTVEAAWYVPSGVETEDLCSTPVTFLNLRGDSLLYPDQRTLISSVCTLAFVFLSMNHLAEHEFDQLKQIYSQCDSSKIVLVIVTLDRELGEKYKSELANPYGYVLLQVGGEGQNVANLRNKIREGLRVLDSKTSLNRIQEEAEQLGMKLDSSQIPHDSLSAVGRLASLLYSPLPPNQSPLRSCLPLQHTGWPDWCEGQRELHTLCCVTDNMSALTERIGLKCRAARQEQYEILMQGKAPFILEFIAHCKQLSVQQDSFEFLWKILITQLDTNNRVHSRFPAVPLALLNTSIPLELQTSLSVPHEPQTETRANLAPVIHGEHILRELGQLFETYDCATAQEKRNLEKTLPYSPAYLPQFAAELLLRGHSYEVLDGEANHVPVRWVKRVIEALSSKVGRDKRLFVIGIIGVQSSGKSTLLNTMFGQNLAVSSARCTRGVLMQLIAVSAVGAGFDYIVLLDTEGLANPQQDAEVMRNHDNELATFVVGLSDLTIVNISMESTVEVRNILQITVLALIRMQLTFSKPKCIFVHQNVVDIMASLNLQETRESLVAFLNENTRSAAIYKHQTDKLTNFNDVIEFDPNRDVWYFPGYQEGTQAMSWVSENYSKQAQKLRQYILESNCGERQRFQTVGEWALKLENIWICVLKEDFVFHYKNVKEINDHFELDSVLAGWSFQFSNEMCQWASAAINQLSNCGSEDLSGVWKKLQEELASVCQTALKERQQEITVEYFESSLKKQSFIKWRNWTMDFFTRTRTQEQQRIQTECFNFHATQFNLQLIKRHFETTKRFLSDKVRELFEQVKKENRSFESQEVINEVFEEEWNNWISNAPSCVSVPRLESDIQSDIQTALLTTPCLQAIKGEDKVNLCEAISDYSAISNIEFELGKHHFSVTNNADGILEMIKRPYNTFFQLLETLKASTGLFPQSTSDTEDINYTRAQKYTDSLSDRCKEFVNSLPNNANYNKSYITSLVELVATETIKLNHEEKSSVDTSIEFSKLFILEFAFYQCCRASSQFKQLQDSFLERTNPDTQLQLLKTDLKQIFTSLCEGIQKEDSSSSLLAFLLAEGIKKSLIDTVQRVAVLKFTQEPEHENIYRTRQLLHLQVLKDLAKKKSFDNYIQYIHHPLQYMESWIKKNLAQYCTMDASIERIKREVLDPLLREKIELIRESGLTAVPENNSDQFNPTLWGDWKVEFHSRISACVRDIDIDTLSRIDTYAVTNIPQFCQFLYEHLIQLADKFDWTDWLHGLMRRGLPAQPLICNLLECRALCPFCREPCQRGGTQHQHYCGSFHRPKGIGGCYHNMIKTLSIAECTSSVGSTKRFWYGNTSYAYADYRQVNDMFASWRILPDDAVESRYWQWVLFHFQEQFCGKYGYAANKEVTRWSNLTEEDIVEDLERHYQNYCFKAN